MLEENRKKWSDTYLIRNKRPEFLENAHKSSNIVCMCEILKRLQKLTKAINYGLIILVECCIITVRVVFLLLIVCQKGGT